MSQYGLALRPILADNPWASSRSPLQLFQRHLAPFPSFNYDRPWRHLEGAESGTSSVAMDKDGIKIMMDVQHFTPKDISVKQVEDCVVVEGKHEESEDEHGWVARHFVRRYVLPKGVDHHALTSNLSSDGVLTITAPKVKKIDGENARSIPIEHTGQPTIKDAEKKDKQK